MTRAIPWDGIGPKRECLFHIRWNHDSDAVGEWVHMQFENAYGGYNEQYLDRMGSVWVREEFGGPCGDSKGFVPGGGFTITHYAELPTIARVIVLNEEATK